MSSPVAERRGSAMHASRCGRETGLRCRPAPSTRIRWSMSRPSSRSSISVSRRCVGQRLWSIPIPAKSAPVSPIREARSASAALACSGRQRHARLLGERARGGLSLVRPGHSLGDGANPMRRGKRNRDDPVIQGKGVHWSSPAVTHGVEPRTAVSARLAHYRVPRRRSHTRTGSSRSGLASGTGFMSQCRHRGSGPGGVSNGHTRTLGGPPSITRRSGWEPRAARCSPLPAG